MSRLSYKNNKDKVKIITFWLVIISVLIITIWAQNNYVITRKYVFQAHDISKSFVGYRILHISDICNTSNRIVDKAKKLKPDIIVLTGGYFDINGDSDNTIKIVENLCDISPVYYIYNTNDISQILDCTSAINLTNKTVELNCSTISPEEFIKKNYGNKIIKKANKGDNEAVQYMQYISDELSNTKDYTIKLSGIDNMIGKSTEEITEKTYELVGSDERDLSILLNGNLANMNAIALSIPDIILSGGTFGKASDITSCTKGVYSYHGTELFLSGGCGNYNEKRVFNLPEIQLIILSDGTIKQYNPVEEVLKKFIGDVGTIYDNDGGFQSKSYSGSELKESIDKEKIM